MDISIKFDTVKSVWSIVYIEGSQVILSKIYCISFLANSADPNEMTQSAALQQGLHSLQKFPVYKGYTKYNAITVYKLDIRKKYF